MLARFNKGPLKCKRRSKNEILTSSCCSAALEFSRPTDPAEAPKGSIRRTILEDYKALGLTSEPNKGDNGVHASASPFEGLAERNNWLNINIKNDPFGAALMAGGLSESTITEWCKDPQVQLTDTDRGSVFDALEDMDVGDCLQKLITINELNSDLI
jgi:hypothetical protein